MEIVDPIFAVNPSVGSLGIGTRRKIEELMNFYKVTTPGELAEIACKAAHCPSGADSRDWTEDDITNNDQNDFVDALYAEVIANANRRK